MIKHKPDNRPQTIDKKQDASKKHFSPFFVSVLVYCLWSMVYCLPAYAEETIETKEYERYYYKDGSLLKLEGQFEHTYHLDLEKNILTRTRIYDVVNKKVTPDNTEYHMERQLLSHPTNADRYILTPVIRAVGQTSADTVEMLIIDDAYVQTTSSTSNEIILSRSKRIQ